MTLNSKLFWWWGTSEADRRACSFLGNVPKHILPKCASASWYSCVCTNFLRQKWYLWLQICAPPFPECYRETLWKLNLLLLPKWEPSHLGLFQFKIIYCTFCTAKLQANAVLSYIHQPFSCCVVLFSFFFLEFLLWCLTDGRANFIYLFFNCAIAAIFTRKGASNMYVHCWLLLSKVNKPWTTRNGQRRLKITVWMHATWGR